MWPFILALIILTAAFLSYFAYYTTRVNKQIYKIEEPITTKVIPQFGERDAFGRERVAMPFTLADYDHVFGNNIDFLDVTSGSGTIEAIDNQAAIRLSIAASASGSAIHQSKRYHHYMPGKSQFILASFLLKTATPGITKRLGYFDDDNGIFLEQDGDGTLYFKIRSYTSGTGEITESVAQSEWNNNNYSKIDVTKTQLLFIDFQWLGVGKVRCGFIEGDQYILCHTFYHSNVLDKVFMSNPNLPIRCEITGDGSNTNEANFEQICSTVISEGGYSESGRDWSFGTSNAVEITADSEQSILAIKLSDTFNNYDNHMTVRLGNVSLLSDGDNIFYRVLRVLDSDNGITGNWNYINESDSGVMYALNPTLQAGVSFYQIESGYASGGTDKKNSISSVGNAPPLTAKQNYITQNYNSDNSEAYLVIAKNIGTAATDVFASMQWREIY